MTMQYMLLIYDDEKLWQEMSKADLERLSAEYNTFSAEIVASGHLRAGGRLQPSATATTVRVRDSKTQTTDGPFAETKEQLAGYYLVEANDLDEAMKLAARIPSAKIGSIEVRPLFPMR
jgi:hypothetical protein